MFWVNVPLEIVSASNMRGKDRGVGRTDCDASLFLIVFNVLAGFIPKASTIAAVGGVCWYFCSSAYDAHSWRLGKVYGPQGRLALSSFFFYA